MQKCVKWCDSNYEHSTAKDMEAIVAYLDRLNKTTKPSGKYKQSLS
jgi:hypothetical protein